ncbi:S-methyl-5-thioribose-1-phosphate isomerase [Candidatus Micrarchaeota archaeon]|nr:S-methyl-5-thioribose-1-phosphate isomerase [Candidatus Micrarchaeota archaeon]
MKSGMKGLSSQLINIYDRIKHLEIQSARNIMRMALLAYIQELEYCDAKTYKRRMKQAFNALTSARPTEPMMFNALSVCMEVVNKYDYDMAREHIELLSTRILDKLIDDKEKISLFGTRMIHKQSKIMTICHSSTVVAVLTEAHRQGKEIEVYSCETRPRWQGHITSQELASAGIKVNMIVDGAMGHYIDDVDIILVGCDAVDKHGNFVNKIGTRSLAELAKNHHKKFYVAGELLKLDHRYPIPIEFRDVNEVADPTLFKGVNILNPAFDLVPAKYVTAFITEKGIIKPKQFYKMAVKELKRLIS